MSKVYKYNVPGTTNTIVFSTDNPDGLANYQENMDRLESGSPLLPIAKKVFDGSSEVTDAGRIFTDDLAPVEVLGQKVLNDIVRDSLIYFKQELSKPGNDILDVFNMLS